MLAICFAGELRSFPAVRANIRASLHPVENTSDVFAFLKTPLPASQVRRLFAAFHLVALRLRPTPDPYRGIDSHVGCWPMITRRETRQGPYQFVMRLRTDVMYDEARYLARLPWPRADAIHVEACGEFRRRGDEARDGTCKRMHGNRFGCVKDTWALMGRRAAATYFRAPPPCVACLRATAECRLGASIFRDPGVTVLPVALRRRIVRGKK